MNTKNISMDMPTFAVDNVEEKRTQGPRHGKHEANRYSNKDVSIAYTASCCETLEFQNEN